MVGCCGHCGLEPQPDVVAGWAELEHEVQTLVEELPQSLYSAWAICEDFSITHPCHWLTGHWKLYIAGHVEMEAVEEDDLEQAAELRCEASDHRGAYWDCAKVVCSSEFAWVKAC